ncbi:S-layer homology domain-containing protein [Brevibacillus massiliensis]|uniref:S-layer homology domain-containing protein n=1 Tax=Brevibacillus massiliensis TaxID=1118054 RepID=UPI00030234C4|nr:S-layer homology domain-containing protein [Brevibacillus massiliensis]
MWKKTVLLCAILLFAWMGQAFAYDARLTPFKDVAQNDWAKDRIYMLSALNIISGYEDQTFRPGDAVTREAFITMLVKSLSPAGNDGNAGPSFSDVDTGRWSYPYIKRAYDKGLIGFMAKDQALRPASNITRQEVAMLVGSYLFRQLSAEQQAQWLETGWKAEQAARHFSDANGISAEYAPYVYYASHQGIMIGDDKGTFRPGSSLTRREAAAILYAAIDQGIKNAKLTGTGFYAIRSYQSIDKMNLLSNVIFGWSHLEYSGAGNGRLSTVSTEYSVPEGWETVIEAANRSNVFKQLMVYADNQNGTLSKFLGDQPARQMFIQTAQAAMADEKYGFTGIALDFEGLTDATDKDNYTSFIQQLKANLGGKTLTVAVPPTFYYKGYDLLAIGQTADQVILMAYDFTHKESSLPSAPLPLVAESIRIALGDIPREKLVLGISKQANQWIQTASEVSLQYPSVDLVEQRLQMPNTAAQFSVPYFLERITFADERGKHELWYENAESIEKKLWIAKYYGLHGVSLWYMGSFTQGDWSVIQANIR